MQWVQAQKTTSTCTHGVQGISPKMPLSERVFNNPIWELHGQGSWLIFTIDCMYSCRAALLTHRYYPKTNVIYYIICNCIRFTATFLTWMSMNCNNLEVLLHITASPSEVQHFKLGKQQQWFIYSILDISASLLISQAKQTSIWFLVWLSVCLLVSQSVSWSVGRSGRQLVGWSRSVGWSVCWSVGQSVGGSVSGWVSWSVSQSVGWLVGQSVC